MPEAQGLGPWGSQSIRIGKNLKKHPVAPIGTYGVFIYLLWISMIQRIKNDRGFEEVDGWHGYAVGLKGKGCRENP